VAFKNTLTNDWLKMTNYSQALYVLGIALVEIRATDSIDKARVFADVVHNVPSMIANAKSEAEVISEVMAKARRQRVEGYFAKLFEKAKARF